MRKLAKNTPELSDLDADTLVKLGRVVTAEALRDELKHLASDSW